MQAQYPYKTNPTVWDSLRTEYPVRKFPGTPPSSETIGRSWRDQPEVLKLSKDPLEELKRYSHDYNITKALTRSQSTLDFGYKIPKENRFNKHTSLLENHYVYPASKMLSDQPPMFGVHGTTEMRSAYTPPTTSARLVTDKDQFKHRISLDPPILEPSWHKELEPLDTTHEGFEKYLDPYLTTSRLHHRPYTADQISRLSNNKDIVTYHTLSKEPWTRTPKHKSEEWKMPSKKPTAVYDTEKFTREVNIIEGANKLHWVPRSFRTETRDNYVSDHPESRVVNYEKYIHQEYRKNLANLEAMHRNELCFTMSTYKSENSTYGSRKPVCSVLEQYVKRNKRLES